MTARINISVDDEIPALLRELAGSTRKQGEFVSGLIRAAHSGHLRPTKENSLLDLNLQLSGQAGQIESLRTDVDTLKRQLEDIEAKVAEA
ncbi:MAG: hypothetical protein R3A44_44850 [Caldilineaceae bacterium]